MFRTYVLAMVLAFSGWLHADPAASKVPTKEDLVEQADGALAAGDWERADRLLEMIVSRDPKATPSKIPAWRQQIPFKRGWCALQMGKWEAAMKHFERSYRDFNDLTTNPYQKLSLRGWADAAAGAGDPEQAVKLYRRYLREASRTDWENPFRQSEHHKR